MSDLPEGVLQAIEDAIADSIDAEERRRRELSAQAGKIPPWYGDEHPASAWMRMWRSMAAHGKLTARDAVFYEAGAIGWASR